MSQSLVEGKRAKAKQVLEQGVALHRAGRLIEAESLYRQALQLAPGDPSAVHLLGVVAFARGDLKSAAKLIGQALKAEPGFANAHLNFGNVLQAEGRPAEAAASYRRAIVLTPGSAMAHSNLARVLNELNEPAAAIESAQTAIRLDPGMAAGHVNLGAALAKAKRFAEAETAYLWAAALEPNRAETLRDLATVLTDLDRLDQALFCYGRALALKPNDAPTHCARGRALVKKHDFVPAEASFRRATELDPALADAWIGLAWSLRLLGRFAEADACFERLEKIAPERRGEVVRGLATPGPAPNDAQQISRLTEELDRAGGKTSDRFIAGFALGRLLDSSDRYDEAFERYRVANALVKETNAAAGIRFDFEAFRQRVDLLISRFPRGRVTEQVGERSELPVFIVGMPRSGTTLVEQIAASHSQVFGAGELHEIGAIADTLAGGGARQVAVRETDADLAARLARGHLLRLRGLGGGAARVVDKMPDNVLHLDLIAQLFPGARVIFCTRDARDIGLSCYFQLFSEGLQTFSYDLADCGRRTAEVNRLIAHWKEALPLPWHEVNYERLVADLEGESRRLIDFLGLAWEDACLEFHRTERTVATVSHWQVRQPLYTRSVGRWRLYERHLAPLLEGLHPEAARS